MNNDKLIIGGHEFDSRFILGSGKYSLNLFEAAIKDAGAQIISCGPPCQYQRPGKHTGLYSKRHYSAPQHKRREKCRRSRTYRKTGAGARLR